jgi:uncharacterized protein YqjF (DUF2071 family)
MIRTREELEKDPGRAWLVSQRWERVLFAHWPTDPRRLARLLPPGVEPDVYAGEAWLAIVAFVMEGTRMPYGPAWRGLPPIPELNVRTYVRVEGVPGVWFLSLDATSPLFVSVGRALYGLRYSLAKMATAVDGERVYYLSAGNQRALVARYEPAGVPSLASADSLERFLIERYRLFAERHGRLITATVTHEPWPLQRADAHFELNTMAPPQLAFEGRPLLHFSRSVSAKISAPWQLPVGSVLARDAARRFSRRRRGDPRSRRLAGTRGYGVPADAR